MALPVWLGIFLTPLLVVAFGLSGYILSAGLLRQSGSTARLAAATGLTFFVQGVHFYLLMALRAFHWSWAVLLSGALIAGSVWHARHDAGLRETFRLDREALAKELRALGRSGLGWGAAGLALLILPHLARALVTPPLDWDSLTYQLVRPGLWIQAQGPHDYRGPGLWDVYDSRMVLGNAWSGWHMLLPRSDALVPLAWFEVWCVLLAGAYVLSRRLGASVRWAFCGAAVVGLLPAARAHMVCAYVDSLVGALVVLATVLLVVCDQRRDAMSGAVAVGVLATAMAVKKTAAPFLLGGALVFVVLLVQRHRSAWKRPLFVVVTLGACALAPAVVYLWTIYDSPIYPYPLVIGDRVIFEGAAFADGMGAKGRSRPLLSKLLSSFLIGYEDRWYNHVNFGAFFPILLAVAVGGWIHVRRLSTTRAGEALFFLSCLVVAVVVYSPTGTGLDVARYGLGGAAIVIVFACNAPRARIVLLPALAFEAMFLGWWSWSEHEKHALVELSLFLTPFLALAVATLAIVRLKATARLGFGLTISLGLLWLGLSVTLEPVRRERRHAIYHAAGQGRAWTAFPVTGGAGFASQSAAVFHFLDRGDPAPKRVAVTVGMPPDPRGINWFVYPAMGEYLQNQIVYVSPLRGGRDPGIITVGPHLQEHLDYDDWLLRLHRAGVSYVANLAPTSYELVWMRSHPEDFEVVACGGHPTSCVFRLLDARQAGGSLSARQSHRVPLRKHFHTALHEE